MDNKNLEIINEQGVLGKTFCVYGTFEDPLFLAKEVADWIDYDKSSINKMLRYVDEDEKVRNNVPNLGGAREMWFLTEDGVYEVLMQSRKQFKKKVKEILKTLRKTGAYVSSDAQPLDNAGTIQLLVQQNIKLMDHVSEINKRMMELLEKLSSKEVRWA